MTTANISADYPFESNYIEVLGSKMHYVDVGSGPPILFLHGNPTSSYLWRNIIPHVTSLGRCIAPDLIGMGKSDKPDIDYSFFDHAAYVDAFIDKMDLKDLILFIHDWGSAIGFRYTMNHESNVRAIAFMEAIIMPVPSWDLLPQDMREIFQAFRTPDVGQDLIINKNIFLENVLPGGIVRKLSDKEMQCYREPFAEPASRKPVWRWPNEIPIEGHPPDVTRAVETFNKSLTKSELPKLLFHATPGAIMTKPVVDWCKENLPNLKTVDIGEGIHFVQEDHPDLIGSELAKWITSL